MSGLSWLCCVWPVCLIKECRLHWNVKWSNMTHDILLFPGKLVQQWEPVCSCNSPTEPLAAMATVSSRTWTMPALTLGVFLLWVSRWFSTCWMTWWECWAWSMTKTERRRGFKMRPYWSCFEQQQSWSLTANFVSCSLCANIWTEKESEIQHTVSHISVSGLKTLLP